MSATSPEVSTLGTFTAQELVVVACKMGVILDRPELLEVLGVVLPRRRAGGRWAKTPECKALVRALYGFQDGIIPTRAIGYACGVSMSLVTRWTADMARNKRGAVYPRGSTHGGSLAKKEPAVVAAIRERIGAGESCASIARGLEVTRETVNRYAREHAGRAAPQPTLSVRKP